MRYPGLGTPRRRRRIERGYAILTVIGVMGGGTCDGTVAGDAARVGALIAERGWVLLTGGRDCGVMAAASRGAKEAGGLVVGVLPDDDVSRATPHIDVPIVTGLGDARNAVNVLSSRVVVALPGGAGTLSEVALALKARRPVVALAFDVGRAFDTYRRAGLLVETATPEEAIDAVAQLLEAGTVGWEGREWP